MTDLVSLLFIAMIPIDFKIFPYTCTIIIMLNYFLTKLDWCFNFNIVISAIPRLHFVLYSQKKLISNISQILTQSSALYSLNVDLNVSGYIADYC